MLGGGVAVAAALVAFERPVAAHASVPFALSNPFAGYTITDDHSAHLNRIPASGGVDFAMAEKTPLPACASGTLQFFDSGTGAGRVARILLPGGWASDYQHCYSIAGLNGRQVAMGEIIAYSGGNPADPGAGATTGPHLHWHLLDPFKVRADPLANINTAYGMGPQPQPYQKRSGIMETVVSAPNGLVVHIYPGGKHNFSSPTDYNTTRDEIAFLRASGASNLFPLPTLDKVPRVSWETFTRLCAYVGAPTA